MGKVERLFAFNARCLGCGHTWQMSDADITVAQEAGIACCPLPLCGQPAVVTKVSTKRRKK